MCRLKEVAQAWEYIELCKPPVASEVFYGRDDFWDARKAFMTWAATRGYVCARRDGSLVGFYCVNPTTGAGVELWPYDWPPPEAREAMRVTNVSSETN